MPVSLRPATPADAVEPLVNLRFLGFSECGEIASLAPIASLNQLEMLHADPDVCG